MPIPIAARKLAKFFDLRGELSTINHIRRARCRTRCAIPIAFASRCWLMSGFHRALPPVLLERLPTPQQPNRSATSLGFTPAAKKADKFAWGNTYRKVIDTRELPPYSPPESARQIFPSSLQVDSCSSCSSQFYLDFPTNRTWPRFVLKALYLPPARQDINIAEDVRYNAKDELKEGGKKAASVGVTLSRFKRRDSKQSRAWSSGFTPPVTVPVTYDCSLAHTLRLITL